MLLVDGFSGCTVSLDAGFLCPSLLHVVYVRPSKISTGSAAAGAAASKAAEASPTAAVIIATTASAKAPSSAPH